MSKKIILLIALVFLIWSATNLFSQIYHVQAKNNSQSDTITSETDHSGHDYDSDTGHDETDHSGHDHADEFSVQMTTEGIDLAGIVISKVQKRGISKSIDLSGEIGFNEDMLAHISPRFAGIAQQANYRVGDYVNKGSIVAKIESNESMNSYLIKAPVSGWVIERNITTGEYVSEENSIFVIADLSTVWVNLAVYPKDAHQVRKGQIATISPIDSDKIITGSIEFVTPIMDFHTRSATARVILKNNDNNWRPGSFVRASLSKEIGEEGLVVEKNAVQYLDEKSVVFVADGPNSFRPIDIITGESDGKYIQILGGLGAGSKYVSSGAFELKAKIVTSNMDAHAGHNH